MSSELQPVSWEWIKAVLGSAVVVVVASGVAIAGVAKVLAPHRLKRLPGWLRWLLVVPAAFLVGLVAETTARIAFAGIELVANHELLFRPGVDSLVWQLWAPLFFVAGGLQLAPSHHVSVFVALAGFKVVVAASNLATVLGFTQRGGAWSTLDPVTRAPLWWNATMYIACILVLVAAGVYLIREDQSRRAHEAAATKNHHGPPTGVA